MHTYDYKHRTLLSQSEEHDRVISDYKEQVLCLSTDKSTLQSELETMKQEISHNKTLSVHYDKVSSYSEY